MPLTSRLHSSAIRGPNRIDCVPGILEVYKPTFSNKSSPNFKGALKHWNKVAADPDKERRTHPEQQPFRLELK